MSLNATNVNDTISFNWDYGWCSENMPSSRPLVNPLIKAMLNENPDEMEQLFCMGAEIEKTDSSTFERAF